jgi:hypothetical protein
VHSGTIERLSSALNVDRRLTVGYLSIQSK